MKKLLALALVLVLALSLTAVSLADEVVVAKIGDTEYTALADAFSAAQDGDTIVLQHDAAISGYVGTPDDASVTLDLNGFAITGGALDVYGGLTVTGEGSITAGAKHAIWVNGQGAELTVKSGTITGGTGYAIVANNDDSTAKINIEGGLIRSGAEGAGTLGLFTCHATISGGTILSEVDNTDAIELSNDSTLTISGGEIKGHDWGIAAFGTAQLTITGGTITTADDEGYAVTTNGNAGQSATITISGGTIRGAELGAYAPSGKWVITGGNIEGATGLYFKSTSLHISGDATIVGNGEARDYNYYGNGANYTGDALVIDSCGYPNGISDVSVTGGTFRSANAQGAACYTHEQNTPVTKFISGGTFSSIRDNSYLVDNTNEVIRANGDVVVSPVGNYDAPVAAPTVSSPKTADLGVALYAVLALTSATGTAWACSKRKDI